MSKNITEKHLVVQDMNRSYKKKNTLFHTFILNCKSLESMILLYAQMSNTHRIGESFHVS